MSAPKTPEQHAAEGGTTCPYCGSNNIEAGFLEADMNQAWSTVQCLDCNKEYRELYTLTGYEELKC